ncbi:uracil-DNA glycosylase [Halobacillus rhizosphaerae]|uniref:uracil-DNA glycosylase n=1 Tax=Halobacillus rhizosphaerae TaxID=3064889 RepID=UPI00398AD0D7
MKKINCFECAHFFTTWNPSYPRGCKAYEFKSKEMPASLVFQTTGTQCEQFQSKQRNAWQNQPGSSSKIDFKL